MTNSPSPEENGRRLHLNQAHRQHVLERWLPRGCRYRGADEPYPEEWYRQQCGACRYFVRLTGALYDDWGACTNERSPMDGRATFEHDGCDAFAQAGEDWDYAEPSAGPADADR